MDDLEITLNTLALNIHCHASMCFINADDVARMFINSKLGMALDMNNIQ